MASNRSESGHPLVSNCWSTAGVDGPVVGSPCPAYDVMSGPFDMLPTTAQTMSPARSSQVPQLASPSALSY